MLTREAGKSSKIFLKCVLKLTVAYELGADDFSFLLSTYSIFSVKIISCPPQIFHEGQLLFPAGWALGALLQHRKGDRAVFSN
jgi:hypothetical protein